MKGKYSAERVKRKTLTVILLAVGVFDVAFIIAMIVLFCIFQSVPDVLIQSVLGASGVEAFVSAAIQISKIIFKDKNDETEVEG
jgi:hypothetical protein